MRRGPALVRHDRRLRGGKGPPRGPCGAHDGGRSRGASRTQPCPRPGRGHTVLGASRTERTGCCGASPQPAPEDQRASHGNDFMCPAPHRKAGVTLGGEARPVCVAHEKIEVKTQDKSQVPGGVRRGSVSKAAAAAQTGDLGKSVPGRHLGTVSVHLVRKAGRSSTLRPC